MIKSSSDRELALSISQFLSPPAKNSASVPPTGGPLQGPLQSPRASDHILSPEQRARGWVRSPKDPQGSRDPILSPEQRARGWARTQKDPQESRDPILTSEQQARGWTRTSKQPEAQSEHNWRHISTAEPRSWGQAPTQEPSSKSRGWPQTQPKEPSLRRRAKSRKVRDEPENNVLRIPIRDSEAYCSHCDGGITVPRPDSTQNHYRSPNDDEEDASSAYTNPYYGSTSKNYSSDGGAHYYGNVTGGRGKFRARRALAASSAAELATACATAGAAGAKMGRGYRRAVSSEEDREDPVLLNAGSCVHLPPHRYSLAEPAATLSPVAAAAAAAAEVAPPGVGEAKDSSTDNSFAFRSPRYRPTAGGTRRSAPPYDAGGYEDGTQIVTINVAGLRFQTYEATLRRYPNSLLGNPEKRRRYFNRQCNEYFLDRHRTTFESILHIYQTCGQVLRPESVPISLFLKELSFYEMGEEVLENFWVSEGYQKPAADVLPTNRCQRWLWQLMECPDSSPLARILAFVSVSVIIVSIVSFCAETLPELRRETDVNGGREWSSPFFWIEFCCSLWFSVELFLRFASSPSKSQFMKSFLNVLDFVAVAPFFINLLCAFLTGGTTTLAPTSAPSGAGGGPDWASQSDTSTPSSSAAAAAAAMTSSSLSFSVLRIIRLVRVFRIFKLSRHSVGLQVLGKTFRASIQEFCLLVFFMGIALILFASGVYFAEQNEPDTKFTSIPASFWFVLATMTTVGYGDLVPQGVYGKIVGSMCALIGVLTLALPVPIIVANFKHFYRQECRLAQIYRQQQQLIHTEVLELDSARSKLPDRVDADAPPPTQKTLLIV